MYFTSKEERVILTKNSIRPIQGESTLTSIQQILAKPLSSSLHNIAKSFDGKIILINARNLINDSFSGALPLEGTSVNIPFILQNAKHLKR